MLEMARAFGRLKLDQGKVVSLDNQVKRFQWNRNIIDPPTDWRPRRSLVFASWGAEEYGLIGSYEWVEEKAKELSQRAVAYLNVDIAVEGECAIFPRRTRLLV